MYDDIIQDMNREDFSVSDKYKSKYDELGKTSPQNHSILVVIFIHLLSIYFHLFLLTFDLKSDRIKARMNHYNYYSTIKESFSTPERLGYFSLITFSFSSTSPKTHLHFEI